MESGRTKKAQVKAPEIVRFASPLAVAKNAEAAMMLRTVVLSAGGTSIGILGLTGVLNGVTAYLLLHLITSGCLLQLCAWKPDAYFPQSASPLKFAFAGVGDNVVIFILLWSLAYAVLHMY